MVCVRAHPPGRIIDRVDILRHYQADMPEGQTADARRSSRVFVRIRVLAKGKNHNGKKFRERCETVVVNTRSEEHTSELQSRLHLVCRLLLEKKKQIA